MKLRNQLQTWAVTKKEQKQRHESQPESALRAKGRYENDLGVHTGLAEGSGLSTYGFFSPYYCKISLGQL